MTITMDEDSIKELLRWAWAARFGIEPTGIVLWTDNEGLEVSASVDLPSVPPKADAK